MKKLSKALSLTSKSPQNTKENGMDLLIRSGFIRQSSQGMFTFLPLGLRVLQRIETLIDREMERIGGQKVSYS
jgi:prolyl-tRNA synthetase